MSEEKNHERKQFRMIAIFIRFKFLLGRPFNKFSHPMHIHTSKTTYIQTVRNYKTKEWPPSLQAVNQWNVFFFHSLFRALSLFFLFRLLLTTKFVFVAICSFGSENW